MFLIKKHGGGLGKLKFEGDLKLNLTESINQLQVESMNIVKTTQY